MSEIYNLAHMRRSDPDEAKAIADADLKESEARKARIARVSVACDANGLALASEINKRETV